MKNFLLFGGDEYYTKGGMEDFISASNDLSDFINLTKNLDWWHIFDLQNKKIILVSENYEDYYAKSDIMKKQFEI